MMDIRSGWRELSTNRKQQCPKLFYSFIADEKGYQLHFTDLIAIWTAQASAEDICGHARLTKTSIDPESRSQLKVLLQKLSQSLAEGSNILKKDEKSDAEALLLETTLGLPAPLEPLQWRFSLQSQPAGEMSEHILRPCLYEASECTKKVDALIRTIEAKDHVISKLLEKIEASSMDLSLIFPGIAGAKARKGQTTVKDAQRHVPGLREFDSAEWRESFHSHSSYPSLNATGLGSLVSGCVKCPQHTTQEHEKWYDNLPGSSTTPGKDDLEYCVGNMSRDPSSSNSLDNNDDLPRHSQMASNHRLGRLGRRRPTYSRGSETDGTLSSDPCSAVDSRDTAEAADVAHAISSADRRRQELKQAIDTTVQRKKRRRL